MNKTTEQKVLKFIHSCKLASTGDKILVALSGGPDSVFLLSFLLKFRKMFDLRLGAFHLNHLLRGKNSEEDETFCRNFCAAKDVEFFLINKNVKALSKKMKISVEEAGRIARYDELKKCAKKNSFNKIATAHNADDNSETVFLNLIKGTGIKGLAGIPPQRDNIIRPLLSISKKEIVEYLNINKIEFRTDETNLSADYERNFLRNEIINKVKERLNPSVDSAILKSSALLRNYYGYLFDQINPLLTKIIGRKDVLIKISELNLIDERLRGLLLQEILIRKLSVDPDYATINSVLKLQSTQAGKVTKPGKNIIAVRERGAILIFKQKNNDDEKVSIKIKPGDSKKIFNKMFTIKKNNKKDIKLNSSKETEFVDASKCKSSFEIRNWKNADRFFPLGMKGSKKLSDFLTEQKVPVSEKLRKLVLTNSGKIVWVVGHRIDDRFKIQEETKKVYELCFR